MQSASAVLHWLMWPVWMYHIIAYYFKWIEYRGNVIYNGMFFVFYFVKKKHIPHYTKNSSRYFF